MAVKNWMSWEGGVDLVAVTDVSLGQPNVIVHVARMVHTPVGSAPSGVVLWQPDAGAAPQFIGFVSSDSKVGAYFGTHIFAGTPFEQAPVHEATITIETDLPDSVSARVEAGGMVFETVLSGLGALEAINRLPADMPPFAQMGIEAVASSASLKVDGRAVDVTVPPIGISGGAAAVWAPAGIYTR